MSLSHFLALDLGTSSLKAAVVDESGILLDASSREYAIRTPAPGHAEQDPGDWWRAAVEAAREAVSRAGVEVSAIGLSGQMHGTVLVGDGLEPVGPAIVWPDQRSGAEVKELIDKIGEEDAMRISGTLPFTGFMAPTLLWLKKNDPRRLERARACVLPKDWLRCRMTGELKAEETDAASTSLFDVRTRSWSDEIIGRLGLERSLFPEALPPAAGAGKLLKGPAGELGLREGTPVVAGCADQVAQAVGNGLFDPGTGSVTLGSGGQILVPMDRPNTAGMRGLHVFCHAPPDRWYVLGALMTAGLSLRWLRDLLGLPEGKDSFKRLSGMAADVAPGAEGLLFLPYLTGERAPLLDSRASGCFLGLTIRHGRSHLARAVMEGVAFAFRHVLETMREAGVEADRMLAAGGGLSDPLWRQIVADVLGIPLLMTGRGEQASVGAALVAALGTGVYADYDDLRALTRPEGGVVTEPDGGLRALYGERYRTFLESYPRLRPIMHGLRDAP